MLAIHFFVPTANAGFAIKDRDYQVVSARIQSGGDGIYILDNKTAQLAVFTYDPASRELRARVKRSIVDAFQNNQ